MNNPVFSCDITSLMISSLKSYSSDISILSSGGLIAGMYGGGVFGVSDSLSISRNALQAAPVMRSAIRSILFLYTSY